MELLEHRCMLSVSGFRPIDEVGNNVANPNLATAGTDLLRRSPAAYKPTASGGDGLNTPGMGGGAPTFVAGPRLVSNVVSNQADPNHPGQDFNTVDQHRLSDFGYTFGQFIDHDLDLTPDQTGQAVPNPNPNKDGNDGFPIPADPTNLTDPIGSLVFSRSIFDPATGVTDARQQINANTSYLDLSQVYGSTAFVADALRTHSRGLLKTSPGNMLPYNNLNYFSQDQLDALHMANDAHLVPNGDLFAAGDVRANETIELTALQTLFLRNHNAIATKLQQSHHNWSDEQVYQEARKLNIAEYQSIIYNAYLPDLLGPNAVPAYTGYDSSVDPSIATEFSTVAFRFGHTLLNNTVERDTNDGFSLGAVSLAVNFFDPHLINRNAILDTLTGLISTDIGPILKGDADNNAQASDVFAVSNIRNLLFGQGGAGEDLIARDLWRADDHGIGTYNQVRAAFGLPPITDDATHGFDQITSDVVVQQLLERAYTGATRDTFLANGKTAGDINPFIAGLAEDHLPGSDLGPLFTTVLVDQFSRLRDGDRFFYGNEAFNAEEQAILNQGATLGKVITANTHARNLQSDVFRHLESENGAGINYFASNFGQKELTGSRSGRTLSVKLYNGLVAALDPNGTGHLSLVDSHGNFLPDTFLRSYSNLKAFLRGASAANAANMLSAQLLTTELNVLLDKVDPTTSILVPAITGITPALQESLATNGVTDSSGAAKIEDLLTAAITELNAVRASSAVDPVSSDSIFETALKECFGAINNNQQIFIL